jgi:hypothetical protein
MQQKVIHGNYVMGSRAVSLTHLTNCKFYVIGHALAQLFGSVGLLRNQYHGAVSVPFSSAKNRSACCFDVSINLCYIVLIDSMGDAPCVPLSCALPRSF